MSNKKRPVRQRTAPKREEFILNEQSPFVIKEAYKSLRTNVILSMPGTDCKCVAITSATPGDGKSTTAANLAISLGQIGKRVLLIDCDMRLPSLAHKFKVHAKPGLSDFLVGQAKIEDAVRKLEDPNIHILPAGSIPPDPTGLLESKQMGLLLNALRGIYDFVIIDLPPVTTVPDAVIIFKYVDGCLLAVREHHTENRKVTDMLRQLNMAGAKILGFVTTNGSLKGKTYYG